VVPVHLKGEGHLVLQYGRNLPIPIPDLQVDESGVSATLSFARAPHQTVVPWSAVYVIASEDGRGVLYNEDIPRDVSVIAAGADTSAGQPAAGTAPGGESVDGEGGPDVADLAPPPPPVRALRAVPLGGTFEDESVGMLAAASPAEVMPARRRRRPQLRLVK